MVEDLAFHLADLVENALRAGAKLVEIELVREGNDFFVRVTDDGVGMTEEVRRRAGDPFFTTKPGRRIGLGLSLLRQTAEELGGAFRVEPSPCGGTRVEARIPWNHPDRPPLGDLASTLVPLMVTSSVDFRVLFRDHRKAWTLDTREMKRILGDVPFTHPQIFSFLEKSVRQALAELNWKEGR